MEIFSIFEKAYFVAKSKSKQKTLKKFYKLFV